MICSALHPPPTIVEAAARVGIDGYRPKVKTARPSEYAFHRLLLVYARNHVDGRVSNNGKDELGDVVQALDNGLRQLPPKTEADDAMFDLRREFYALASQHHLQYRDGREVTPPTDLA